MNKEDIIELVDKSGCKMLKSEVHRSKTKDEILKYLQECKCPVIKKLLASEKEK